MFDEEEYSSDSSDDDYVPQAGPDSEGDELSGEDEGDDAVSDDPDEEPGSKKKTSSKAGGKRKKKTNQKKSLSEPAENDPSEGDTAPNPEADKERVENLWASFKKEVDVPARAPQKADTETVKKAEPIPAATETQKTTKVFEFAGETVKITEEVKSTPSSSGKPLETTKRPFPVKKSGGLSSFASQLSSSKKPKLSILEKSKLDWTTFKQAEGIEEDLKTFNQGKMGFLERQAFLERADVKQFEIEKSLRAVTRKPNQK